jgi:hypothetical protein
LRALAKAASADALALMEQAAARNVEAEEMLAEAEKQDAEFEAAIAVIEAAGLERKTIVPLIDARVKALLSTGFEFKVGEPKGKAKGGAKKPKPKAVAAPAEHKTVDPDEVLRCAESKDEWPVSLDSKFVQVVVEGDDGDDAAGKAYAPIDDHSDDEGGEKPVGDSVEKPTEAATVAVPSRGFRLPDDDETRD